MRDTIIKQIEENIFSGDHNEPLYGASYMPRKFKCAVTVPGDNSVDLLTNDIGLVVICSKEGVLKGCNVDQPRNLAKSVTVE